MDHAFALFPQPALGPLFSETLGRLVLAAVLGGIVGLEREFKHRPAGLRTNMFICFGAAMFTVLSMDLAQGNEATRIASQIIPGIGFIGAGSILRAKGSVTGLTTAATIFVVASIGMACGGGLYWLAIFSTALIMLALLLLGAMETRFSLKPFSVSYAVTSDKSADELVEELNSTLGEQDRDMERMRVSKVNGKTKIIFSMDCTRSEHKQLTDRLRQSPDLRNFDATAEREDD